MKKRWVLAVLGLTVAAFTLSQVAVAADNATPQEVVAKVKQAAATLSKSGAAGLDQFNKKDSPWVWKDSYIFALDCTKMTMAAHPIKPDLIGKDVANMKDTKGTAFFGDLCSATKKPDGVWVEYWWPKPGEKEGSRKISYAMNAPNTPYVVSAGIYDDKATIADLQKMSGK
ncbi:MAG: cache domain-containing protein [Terriglobales bacterium]